MADFNFPKWPPLTRELGRRPRPDDYRPGAPARAPAYDAREMDEGSEIDTPNDRRDEMGTVTTVNLRKLQEQLLRKPLDEMATLIRGLTYGEMIELSEGIWRTQPEGLPITQENLPALLHRWSKTHSAAGSEALEESPPAQRQQLPRVQVAQIDRRPPEILPSDDGEVHADP